MIGAGELARTLGDHQPTTEQVEVVEAALAPVLVVAGAGSGKTATMAARVVHQVVNGLVRPEEVLGLTFTRKAAGELAERVRRSLEAARAVHPSLGSGDQRPQISTYNAFAAGLVRDHALRVGADPDAALITRAGAWQLMDELVRGWSRDLAVEAAPATVVNRALAMADAMRSHLVGVAEARARLEELIAELEGERAGRFMAEERKVAAVQRERLALLDLVAAFEERKRRLGVVEFSDQVAIACEIARRVPAVRAALRERHRLVLLDEFQDTSVAQLDLLADLYGPGHAVTAVGDPNQAIYGWRGASAGSLLGFQERFASPGRPVTTLSLSTAWRNDLAILAAANRVSEPLRAAHSPGAQLIRPLRPREAADAGQVDLSVELTPGDEADAIARWVAERWAPGTGSTAAVLCRARKQFPALLAAMRARGIPATVVGLSGLLSTPEVVDLRCALEVAHDASRGDALMRLLTNDRVGLADLSVLAEWARQLSGEADTAGETASIVEAVDSPPPPGWRTRDGHALSAAARERVTRLRRNLRHIRSLLSHPLPDLVTAAERALGLDIEVASRPGVDPIAARANLDAFQGHAASFAAGSASPTLGAFLAWLRAAEENERGLDMAQVDVSTDVVQILTVHAAKGLEWDVVAVAGLSEGQFPAGGKGATAGGRDAGWLTQGEEFPHPLRGDRDWLPALDAAVTTHKELTESFAAFAEANFEHRMAEERRLAYVAFTRPRHHLLVSASWFRDGTRDHASSSRFLQEVTPLASVPAGLRALPEPPAGMAHPELERELRASYPETDPAGERRARLDAAARAVSAAAAQLRAIAGSDVAPLAALDVVLRDAGLRGQALGEQARALLAERARRATPAGVLLPTHLSASAAMYLVRDPEGFAVNLRRPLPFRPQPQTRVGTEFHAWVEQHLAAPALVFGDEWDEEDVFGDLGTLTRSFRASRWEGRAPLAVELELETAVAGRVIRCRVDAVFPERDGVEVVDWKTGRAPTGRREFDDRQLQLALYRLAYARAVGLPLASVRATFFYVAEAVELPADMWTEAQIEQRFAAALAALGREDAATR